MPNEPIPAKLLVVKVPWIIFDQGAVRAWITNAVQSGSELGPKLCSIYHHGRPVPIFCEMGGRSIFAGGEN